MIKPTLPSEPHRSSFGMDAGRLTALLYGACALLNFSSDSYLLGWLLPLFLIMLEKNSYFVCFHAAQAVIFNLLFFAVKWVLKVVFGILSSMISLLWPAALFSAVILNVLLAVINLFLLIVLVVGACRTCRYRSFRLPKVSLWAEKCLERIF